jgi:hypothetical protein
MNENYKSRNPDETFSSNDVGAIYSSGFGKESATATLPGAGHGGGIRVVSWPVRRRGGRFDSPGGNVHK